MGVKSDTESIKQGVPQGSILGPMFDTIYANNIPNYVKHNNVALYADDTVVYSKLATSQKMQESLQSDMDSLSQWCAQHKLTINVEKPKMMVFAGKKGRDQMKNTTIDFDDKVIGQVSYNYLGVKLDQTPNLICMRHP